MTDVRKSDAGAYECKSSNELGSSSVGTSLMVFVTPRFTAKPSPFVKAVAGSSVSLNCSSVGDPTPVVTWRRQSGVLPAERARVENGTLHISALNATVDAGVYICEAKSGYFKIEARSVLDLIPGEKVFHLLFLFSIKAVALCLVETFTRLQRFRR